ncbi:MAG: hypothetical protein MUE81_04885 [Thermoflexibacter sp.]|nr:hypothetical protein [Thermoflexibacter sp.]
MHCASCTAPVALRQLHCASCTAPVALRQLQKKGAKIQIYSKSFPRGGAMQLKDLDRGKSTI